jgi:hypothetical protein
MVNTPWIPWRGRIYPEIGNQDKIIYSMENNGAPTLSPASGKSGEGEA